VINPSAEEHEFSGNIDKDKRIIKIMILALFEHATKNHTNSRLRTIVVTMGEQGIYTCEI
jgi:hypothetical protein